MNASRKTKCHRLLPIDVLVVACGLLLAVSGVLTPQVAWWVAAV